MKVAYKGPADPVWHGMAEKEAGPFVQISFAHSALPSKRYNKYALIDTGASITCFPQSFVESMGWNPKGSIRIQGLSGGIERKRTYSVNLTIFSRDFNYLTISETGYSFPLIGRDVLNRFKLLLDGPKKELEAL